MLCNSEIFCIFAVMKILFLGDYSNLHACLARELRKRGHDITVVSDGGRYMDTDRDILLDRKPGFLGSVRYLYDIFSILPSLKGYDVVQFINPHFLNLVPGRIKYFFDILKKENRSVFLTLAGNDYYFADACLNSDMFRFSEFKVGDEYTEFEKQTMHGRRWTDTRLRRYAEYFYENIDGGMAILPEYDMAARPILGDRLAFTNIPLQLESLPYSELNIGDGPVKIFIGMRGGMEVRKGTALLLEISRELERELPGKCVVENVRNLPLKEYLRRMAGSHIVLDQLYSYSPGTNGFQAMALGRVAGTGAQPEFYEYIGEPELRPVICLSTPDAEEIKETLRRLILNPEPLAGMGREGRRIVEKHNDVRIVATRFENHWNKILARK